MSRALLLSVRPRFARGLLAGTKTAEVRRRFPSVPDGTTVAIYSSSPEKAIIGTMRVRRLVRSNAEDIWRHYADTIDIGQAELADYLDGASECCVLEVDSAQLWTHAVGLLALRQALHIEPPQSFRYLSTRQLSRLKALGEGSPADLRHHSSLADTGQIPVMA